MVGIAKGILAGIFIGLAAIVNLNCSNPVIGSLLFGFGLFIICMYQFKLYTGIVGYFPTIENTTVARTSFVVDCLITWVCNFIGTAIVGGLYRFTVASANILPKVQNMVEAKVNSDITSLFILGIFCGMLMFLAVSTYKADVVPIIGITTLFLCVSIFILSGFEHSIADMAYLCLANQVNHVSIFKVLIPVTLGNAVGGIGLCAAIKYSQKVPQQQVSQDSIPETTSEDKKED